jgi:Arc/MetJ family transcription regulator
MHIIAYIKSIYGKEACMRTTINVDDELIDKARQLTGIKEKTSLIKLGLEALIARESSRRLARLGGTERSLKTLRRRRTSGA